MKEHIYRGLQAAAGCCLAIAIATALRLEFAVSAGIITLLSLQNTKKETLLTAFRRFGAFGAALLFAWIGFSVFGFTLAGFALYLFLFVGMCSALGWQEALGMCSVLITHFLSTQRMDWPMIANELLLLMIGAGMGIMLNLFLPRQICMIRREQYEVEASMRRVLAQMADAIANRSLISSPELPLLRDRLEHARVLARTVMNNALTVDLGYYVQYMDMRYNQYVSLERIQKNLLRMQWLPEQAGHICGLLRRISDSFHEYNNAEELLEDTERILELFRSHTLPQTREEFEARAVLFEVFHEIEHLLLLKRTFAQSLTPEQKAFFWSNRSRELDKKCKISK